MTREQVEPSLRTITRLPPRQVILTLSETAHTTDCAGSDAIPCHVRFKSHPL